MVKYWVYVKLTNHWSLHLLRWETLYFEWKIPVDNNTDFNAWRWVNRSVPRVIQLCKGKGTLARVESRPKRRHICSNVLRLDCTIKSNSNRLEKIYTQFLYPISIQFLSMGRILSVKLLFNIELRKRKNWPCQIRKPSEQNRLPLFSHLKCFLRSVINNYYVGSFRYCSLNGIEWYTF